VRVMWHKQTDMTQWALGLLNLTVFSTIALTGLALLYGSPDMHDGASPLHFWIGAICALIFLAHTWRRFIPAKSEHV